MVFLYSPDLFLEHTLDLSHMAHIWVYLTNLLALEAKQKAKARFSFLLSVLFSAFILLTS